MLSYVKRALACLLGASLAVTALAFPQSLSDSAPASGCSVRTAMQRTIAELGTDPSVWHVEQLHVGPVSIHVPGHRAWTATPIGYAGGGQVHISSAVPCWEVPSIVHHEWMHLQHQPQWADQLQAEVIADCGSKLLGSTFLPYLQRLRRDLHHGCTHADLIQAATIIDSSPDRGTMSGRCRPGHCPIRKAWIY